MGTVGAEVRRSKIISTVAQIGYEEMEGSKELEVGEDCSVFCESLRHCSEIEMVKEEVDRFAE